jgi:short subunit fatty acids transporter
MLIMLCLVIGVISWPHWASGIMGKEIAVRKRGIGIHYPVLIASAYTMMMTMANGPSQSAPLLAAASGNFLEKSIGGLIPLTQTVLSPFLMTFMLFELLTILLIFAQLMPKKDSAVDISDEIHHDLSASTPRTYSWIVVIYTTIMDFFVPSGGSKFAVEAPYIIAAGKKLGIPVAHVINGYSTTGQLANLIQPFWARPFITAFRVRFQDILPYLRGLRLWHRDREHCIPRQHGGYLLVTKHQNCTMEPKIVSVNACRGRRHFE